MKGGDTIETAQITSLQHVKLENSSLAPIDKKEFLEKLESFLSSEGEKSEEDTTYVKQALGAIESAEDKNVDRELDEEVQALFNIHVLHFLTQNEPTPLSQSPTEVGLQSVSLKDSASTSTVFDSEIVTSTIKIEDTIQRLVVKNDIPLENENHTFEQLIKDIVEPTSEKRMIKMESVNPIPNDASTENIEGIESLQAVNIARKVDSPEATILTETEFKEINHSSLNKIDKPSVETQHSVEPQTISDQSTVIFNELLNVDESLTDLKASPTHLKSLKLSEVESMTSSEQTTEFVGDWFKPGPEISFPDQIIEPTSPQLSQHEGVSQVEQIIIKEFQTVEGNKVTTTHIQLTPEHLGKMKMDLKIENRELQVHIQVEQLETKEWLESQLSLLTSNLTTQDISVGTIQIEVEPMQANPFSFEQGQQSSQEENPFEQQRQWKGQGFNNEPLEEQEALPNIINSARGLSLWA